MQIQENVSLANYSTMRLGGAARFLTTVDSVDDLQAAIEWSKQKSVEVLPIGEGSNIIFTDAGFQGLVIVNQIMGFETLHDDAQHTVVRIGSGEHWDAVVARAVEMGLSGIEALSLIPGTAGATPVQNVGAYGQEIADTLVELEAFSVKHQKLSVLKAEDCKFSYRSSIFKSPKGSGFIITSITLRLNKAHMEPPFYDSLQRQLDASGVTEFSPRNIRDAVVATRSAKLPDPKKVANTGSFFKNPVVEATHFERLKADFPEMPGHTLDDGRIKVPAGWLLESAGFKNYRHTNGMGTYENHALVFVNYSAEQYEALAEFKELVTNTVWKLFNIKLEQEPETI